MQCIKGAAADSAKVVPRELCGLMTELMPNLCEHLDNTSAFFQVSGGWGKGRDEAGDLLVGSNQGKREKELCH